MSTQAATPTGWRRRAGSDGTTPRNIDELYAAFLKEYADETRRKYMRWLNAYALYLDRAFFVHVLDAEPGDIDTFLEMLASQHYTEHPGECMDVCEYLPISKAQRSDARTAIRSFYDWAVERRYKDHQVVPRQRGRRGSGGGTITDVEGKDIFLPHELLDIMEAARQDHPMTEMICGLFAGTGMRPEEQHRLQIEWFTRQRGGQYLRFQRVKKGGDVYWDKIRLGDRLIPILERGTRGRTSGPLILSTQRRRGRDEDGNLAHTPLHPSNVARKIKAVCKQAGVEVEGHPKVFRDTFITLASTEPGLSLQKICDYVAHENPRTTMVYFNGRSLARRGATGRQHNLWGPDWTKF